MPKLFPRVAVMGAGHGGHAIAGSLSLAGCEVTLCELPEYASNLAGVAARGGVEVSGPGQDPPRFARVSWTTNLAEAIRSADVVWIVVPAFVQQRFFEEIVPALRKDQTVLLMPGKFGSPVLLSLIRMHRPGLRVRLAETETLLFATRLQGPGKAGIKAIKGCIKVATVPADLAGQVAEILNSLFPGRFIAASNVLETSLSSIGIVQHPVSTILNASRIEAMGPYRTSFYDVTPSVGRVMERLDAEKREVGNAYGLTIERHDEILHRFYGAVTGSVEAALRSVEGYRDQMAPDSLTHRYISEDVPFGLVPVVEFGQLAGLRMAGCRAMIEVANLLNGTDYYASGRTLKSMGLDGLSTPSAISGYLALGHA